MLLSGTHDFSDGVVLSRHTAKISAKEQARRQLTAGGQRRASAFGRALAAHLAKMRGEPGAYGQLGLSDLFEMREECLREFGFSDVYRCSSLAALGIVQGTLHDWLANSCLLWFRVLSTIWGLHPRLCISILCKTGEGFDLTGLKQCSRMS